MAAKIFSDAELKQFIPGSTAFTWKDVLYSSEADSNGMLGAQYSPDQSVVDNITALFQVIVNPLYATYPGQFKINSCYRSPTVNNAIGGSTTSQHLVGQAIDLDATTGITNRDIFNWIIANKPYDQIIWEYGTNPTPTNVIPATGGNPDWVHVSYNKNTLTQRGKTTQAKLPKPGSYVNIVPGSPKETETPTNDQDTQSGEGIPGNANKTQNVNGEQKQIDFTATFDQIQRNVASLEASDVDVTWGRKSNPLEDSNWISLKQYLLYLATKFTPQSVFPFIELIPIYTLDTSKSATSSPSNTNTRGYAPAGEVPPDVKQNLAQFAPGNWDANKLKNILKERLKFAGAKLNTGEGVDRTTTLNKSTKAATDLSDLFNLDPFHEGMSVMGELTEGGQNVKDQRNVGVRVYGQLVLSPAAIEGAPSKPGGIGFETLEVNAGNSADNGLARITMTLVDIQGNKFTDLNSPWAFIYNVRPGSQGGDFYFRYGWQIRVPDPRDTTDPMAFKFWNHEGWKIFDPGTQDNTGRTHGLKDTIRQQIIPGKQVITLTQSIGGERNLSADGTYAPYNLFDEGISFDETGGTIKVSRTALNDENYVRLSILNPELNMDEHGALKATLSFMTTGSIILTQPLDYAVTLRRAVSARGKDIPLGDVLIAIQDDVSHYELIAIDDAEKRAAKSKFASEQSRVRANTRNFDGFVLVQGPDSSGIQGDIHPDEIILHIDDKHMSMLTTSQVETGVTSLRWFREVLEANDCTLLSPATGSGSGINSAWIITTTRESNQRAPIKKVPANSTTTTAGDLIDLVKTEKDVFSYKFQGSLVTSLTIEKSDANNAMAIQINNNVISGDTFGADLKDNKTPPVTTADRDRDLKILFSQMLSCNIECLCHPWIGPGKKTFVKGMGFFDGEYQIIEVTHKLEGHKFTSKLTGIRILAKNEDKSKDDKNHAAENGTGMFTQRVLEQKDASIVKPNTKKKIFQVAPQQLSQKAHQDLGAIVSTTPSVLAAPSFLSTPTVATVPPVRNSGQLTTLDKNSCNERLGVLGLLKNDPNFLILFTNAGYKTPAESDIVISNAVWCEQRKGNGIDYNWFNTKSNLNAIQTIVLQAISNNMVDYNTALTTGEAIHTKYTVSTNGTLQSIGG
jgi:zinc D-Ala-D-Ala carboxypeptidase